MVARVTSVIQTGKQKVLTLCCLISVCYEMEYTGLIPLFIHFNGSWYLSVYLCCHSLIKLPSITTASNMLVSRSITGCTTELTLYFKEYKIVRMFPIYDMHYHVINFISIVAQMSNRCQGLLPNSFFNVVGNNCGKTLLFLGIEATCSSWTLQLHERTWSWNEAFIVL